VSHVSAARVLARFLQGRRPNVDRDRDRHPFRRRLDFPVLALGREHSNDFISQLCLHTLAIPSKCPLLSHLVRNPRQVQGFGGWSEGDQREIELIGMFFVVFVGYVGFVLAFWALAFAALAVGVAGTVVIGALHWVLTAFCEMGAGSCRLFGRWIVRPALLALRGMPQMQAVEAEGGAGGAARADGGAGFHVDLRRCSRRSRRRDDHNALAVGPRRRHSRVARVANS
jgi:hypothetical protein